MRAIDSRVIDPRVIDPRVIDPSAAEHIAASLRMPPSFFRKVTTPDNLLEIPIPSGFETWFRAGRRVGSAWGTAQSGIYVLELPLAKDTRIQVGALGRCRFPEGRFLYVGRAMRGLEARLARHLRQKKARPRWHIDHLRAKANLLNLWVLPTADPSLECETASLLLASGGRVEIRGFGSSDCLCPSHLLFYPS